jgi:hypothetical protein
MLGKMVEATVTVATDGDGLHGGARCDDNKRHDRALGAQLGEELA